jgi:hypothetical protein
VEQPARKFGTLIKLTFGICAFVLAVLSAWIVWGFDVGHEARFKSETICAPHSGGFRRARITVEAVVPPLQDVALEFRANVVLVAKGGRELALRVNATPNFVLPDGVPSIGLKPGSAFDEQAVLECFEAVGFHAREDSTELAREFLTILGAAGAGPKGEPRAGKYFDVVSYSAEYL